jgi:hypothetical protein
MTISSGNDRTFERSLDDNHIQLLRKEDQSQAKFYEGERLVVSWNVALWYWVDVFTVE